MGKDILGWGNGIVSCPCKGCAERVCTLSENCHLGCARYKKYQDEIRKNNKSPDSMSQFLFKKEDKQND